MSVHPPGQKSKLITRYSARGAATTEDVVAEEEPLEIAVLHRGRRRVVAVTMRTPGRDLDLALGFLFTEGILPTQADLGAGAQEKGNSITLSWPSDLPLDVRPLNRHSYTSSSCGVCGKTSVEQVYQRLPFPDDTAPWSVDLGTLLPLPDTLRTHQQLFASTGGIHAAGLFTEEGRLVHLAEDVGRHNALDKLIGRAYADGALPLYRHVLVLSGRTSFELVQKAAMAGIGLIVSVGAPSSLAVELAEDHGITLCGFVRRDGLNCYAHPQRIGLAPA